MNKKKRKRIIILALITFALLVIGIGAAVLWNVKLTDITVIGNTIYSDEEIISYVFPEKKDTHTLYAMWNNKSSEHKVIPFIKSYELNITGLHSAEIVVYEKGIIGALKYMGTYLYFDSDGYIVDTSSKKLDGVVGIEGFNFDYFVLNDRLPVADDSIFGSILVLSRLIESEGLQVDSAYIDTDMNIMVYVGSIKAYLGQGTDIENKIHALQDILPALNGMKGTLYLNYSATLLDKKEYFFKEDKEILEEKESPEDKENDNQEEETGDIVESELIPGEETTEETTETPTLAIPIVVVDEKTGEISIIWSTEAPTTEEESTDETSEGETNLETVESETTESVPAELPEQQPIEQAPVEQVPEV